MTSHTSFRSTGKKMEFHLTASPFCEVSGVDSRRSSAPWEGDLDYGTSGRTA